MAGVEEAVFEELLSNAPSVGEKARLRSVAGRRASAWLTVTPNVGLGLWLQPGDFRAAAQLRLGLPLGAAGARCVFFGCNEMLDQQGHHALTCKHGGDVQRRHHALARVVHNHATDAGLNASLEMGAGLIAGDQRRPADVLIPSWLPDRDGALDVTVISPHCVGDIIRSAGETAGFAAEHAAKRKHSSNDERCAACGWKCVPLAVETFGAWSTEGDEALCRLAGYVAARTGIPKSVAVGNLFGHLSIALQRANARAIQRRYQFTRPALGMSLAVGRDAGG